MTVRLRHRSTARVVRVEERWRRQYVSGHGDGAVFQEVSVGWFVVLEGNVAVPLGADQPDLRPGELLTMTLEV